MTKLATLFAGAGLALAAAPGSAHADVRFINVADRPIVFTMQCAASSQINRWVVDAGGALNVSCLNGASAAMVRLFTNNGAFTHVDSLVVADGASYDVGFGPAGNATIAPLSTGFYRPALPFVAGGGMPGRFGAGIGRLSRVGELLPHDRGERAGQQQHDRGERAGQQQRDRGERAGREQHDHGERAGQQQHDHAGHAGQQQHDHAGHAGQRQAHVEHGGGGASHGHRGRA